MKKYYKYNTDKLQFNKIGKLQIIKDNVIIILGFLLFLISTLYFIMPSYSITPKEVVNKYIKEENEIVVINRNDNEFSQEKLIDEINRLNFRFPHIVLAQSIIETGHFTSTIFMENHNLFGMREPRTRITTAIGTHRGHAYYDSWVESLFDYGFYSSRYLGKLKTEGEYFQYLSRHYAIDKTYVTKLKIIIKKEKLKEKF